MGFTGAEKAGMIEQLGVKITDRGNVWHDGNWMTSVDGIFKCTKLGSCNDTYVNARHDPNGWGDETV
jgi:NADPH-dependent glutamate synthase beta subunit-like oxidoreductase